MNGIRAGMRLEWQIFLLVFLLTCTSIVFVTGPGPNGSHLETWMNLTNEMFYGKDDFLFSYGPLYWLTGGAASQYSKAAYWLAIAFISAVSAVFWSAIATLAYQARNHVYLAVAFFLFFGSLYFPDAMFLWPFAIAVYLDHKQPLDSDIKLKVYVVLGILSALAIYVRFLYGVVALATFGSYFLSRASSKKDIAGLGAYLAATAAGYIVIGLLIFHQADSLISYLVINKQLSFGNSIDMTLDVVNSFRTFLMVALVVAALNIYVYASPGKKRLWLTVNVLLLLFIKLGFSRADHYTGYFIPPTVTLAFLMIFDNTKLGRYLFATIVCILFYMAIYPSFPGGPIRRPLNTGIYFGINYQDRLASAYPDFKLDRNFLRVIGNGTVDVYPYNNEYAFANKLDYQHRPLFQGYMTLTPTLDSMNEKFFESSNRPNYVLWTSSIICRSGTCNPFDDIDQKYILNEDPLTSSAILLNYHVTEVTNGKLGAPVILMAANKAVTAYSEHVNEVQRMEFGKWYKVPAYAGGVLKIKPQFKLTLYAKVKNLLFRGNILKIQYKFSSGAVREYRLNILNSVSGVFVSPLPDKPSFSGPAPEYIEFETEGSGYFQPDFEALWVTVPMTSVSTEKEEPASPPINKDTTPTINANRR